MKVGILSLLMSLAFVHGDPCPKGYTLDPDGGDCYKTRIYTDYYVGIYTPRSYDQVESDCKYYDGGDLASFHSLEENEFAMSLWQTCNPEQKYQPPYMNIGLKCTGKNCKWFDGSPLTFTNFREGNEPSDDGRTRCYTTLYSDPAWMERFKGIHDDSCGADPQPGPDAGNECWLCSVKAKVECLVGETVHNNGCVSVHNSPLDQKAAEGSCPGGGHLVSIHSSSENAYYAQLAVGAGINGTIYIGGEFSSGKFEWTDGSEEDTNVWANGFPNTMFGTCVQMLLSSNFGVQGQWTNVECNVRQPYICFRSVFGPNAPTAKADAQCPPIQYFTESETIYSPNYPLSIPGQQSCEYVITTNEGTQASAKFSAYDCRSGASLALFDGLSDDQPFMIFSTNSPPPTQSYTATRNVMKMVFTASGSSAPVGFGWQAEFTGK